jgi:hypothetical protein
MDMTRTMGIWRAALSWGNPPTSSKRLRSSKAVKAAEHSSGVMSAVAGAPSQAVGAGVSIFWPFWMKNCVSLFGWKRVTTLLSRSAYGLGGEYSI